MNEFVQHRSRILWIFVFLVGVTRTLDLDVLGRVVVSEILMVASIPLLLITNAGTLARRDFVVFLALTVLAVLSISISDIYINYTPYELYARGLARVVAFILIVLFWSLVLTRDFNVLLAYLWGSVIAVIINLFRVSEFDRDGVKGGGLGYDFWISKVGPLSLAVASLAAFLLYRRNKLLAAVVYFAVSVLMALKAGRSIAAISMVCGFVVCVIWFFQKTGRGRFRVTPRQLINLCVAITIAGGAAYIAYVLLAPAGFLGEFQREKFETQSKTTFGVTPWGILLGGRADFLQAILAIKASPMWGVGSWSLSTSYLFESYELLGLRVPAEIRYLGPAVESAGHTVIMGFWATGGVLTLPLWILVIYFTMRGLVGGIRIDNGFTPYIVYTALMVLFTIFFNPFSLGGRNIIGIMVGISFAISTRASGVRVGQKQISGHAQVRRELRASTAR